jgi:ferredoxin/flavodoxin---NADP+ reductase
MDPGMHRPARPERPTHVIGVCGGAVAGSEAAARIAARGAIAVVLEQNDRPYGKIEDGLPRWHVRLRRQEYGRIDANLDHPNVLFVPRTRLGRDLAFDELTEGLGLSAVVLATGAWRDRPLPVPDADAHVDRGLVYQNPFVYWFNHYTEAAYAGPRYEVPDRAIVVGGGLASIDVVKIINFELYGRALRARGVDVDVETFETKGIPRILEEHGIDQASLGIHGCTLYYRRRKQDMPLATADDPTPEQQAKLETARVKIMDKVMRKYLVHFEERCAPVAPVVKDGRLGGLVFQRTEVRDGRVRPLEGSEMTVEAPLVVSSIGSVPEVLPGVPMKGELYHYEDWDTGALHGHEGVFGLGNVLTGRGNIKDSRRSAQDVIERLLAAYLGVGDDPTALDRVAEGAHQAAAERAEAVVQDATTRHAPLPTERVASILARVEARWAEVGYGGDYRAWIDRVTPPDMQ